MQCFWVRVRSAVGVCESQEWHEGGVMGHPEISRGVGELLLFVYGGGTLPPGREPPG